MVTDHEALLTRRALLAAGMGGIVLTIGCTTRNARPVADPDAAAIEAARRGEQLLLAGYAEGSAAHAVHLAHLRALGGTPPSAGPDGSPAPSPAPSAAPGQAATESTTVGPLMAAARSAHHGSTAALFASIAASHAVLVGVPPR